MKKLSWMLSSPEVENSHTAPVRADRMDSTPQKGNRLIVGFDVMKFVMALIVMNGHSGWSAMFPDSWAGALLHSLYPLTVPFFFMVSSFLFFQKVRQQPAGGWRNLLGFEKRVNILYLFWIAVLSPFVLFIFHQEYLQTPWWISLVSLVKDYFLTSVFVAGWYLGAMIVGLPLVYGLLRVFTARFCWLPVLLLYLYLYNADPQSGFFHWYETMICNPFYSFPHALLWLTLGYYLSDGRLLERIQSHQGLCWAAVCAYLLNGFFFPEQGYLLLLLAVPSIVSLAYFSRLSLSDRFCKRLRVYSTHFYCMHTSVLLLIAHFVGCNMVVCYFICIVCCWMASEIIIYLMGKKRLGWLRYSY